MIKKNKQQDEFINKISLKERLGKKELTKIKKANDDENQEGNQAKKSLNSLYSKEALASFFEHSNQNQEKSIIPYVIKIGNKASFILQRDWPLLLASFLIPIILFMIVLAIHGFYPFGDISLLTKESTEQNLPLLAEFQNKIQNFDTIFYTTHAGLGYSFFHLYSYYLASPFNLLLFFFSSLKLDFAIFFITLLKLGAASLSFAFFLRSAWCLTIKEDKQNSLVLICAILYSVNAYTLAYLSNLIWLDALVFAPLVLLGIHLLVNHGKIYLYTLSLAFAIWSHYYAAFFICIFSLLYFIFYLTANQRGYSFHASQKKSLLCLRIFQFLASSLLAAGLMSWLLIPVWEGIQATPLMSGEIAGNTRDLTFFQPLKFFASLFFGSEFIGDVNLPPVYASVLTLLALPLYWSCKNIRLREKISLSSLLFFLYGSLNFPILNQIWHGMHIPYQLPYRFSYLYILVSILILFRLLSHIESLQIFKAIISLAFVFLTLLSFFVFGPNLGVNINPLSLAFNFGLIIIYSIIIFLKSYRRKMVLSFALIIVLIIESSFAGILNFNEQKENLSFQKASSRQLRRFDIKPLVDTIKKQELNFYRMEVYPSQSFSDALLYNYPGIAIFSSTLPYSRVEAFSNLGYTSNNLNLVQNGQQTAIMDLLLGIKYHIRTLELGTDKTLKQVHFTGQEKDKNTVKRSSVYQRYHHLPLAYVKKDNIELKEFTSENVFQNQETLVGALSGKNYEIFQKAKMETKELKGLLEVKKEDSLSLSTLGPAKMMAEIEIEASQDGQMYLHIKQLAATKIHLKRLSNYNSGEQDDPLHKEKELSVLKNTPYVPEENKNENSWEQPYSGMLDLGYMKKGEKLLMRIEISGEVPFDYIAKSLDPNVVTLRAMTMDLEKYEDVYQDLRKETLKIDSYSSKSFAGKIDLARDAELFVSIPYEKGWKFYLDGQEIKPKVVANLFYSLPLPAGKHELAGTYTVPELPRAGQLSLLAVFVFILLAFFSEQINNRIRRQENT